LVPFYHSKEGKTVGNMRIAAGIASGARRSSMPSKSLIHMGEPLIPVGWD